MRMRVPAGPAGVAAAVAVAVGLAVGWWAGGGSRIRDWPPGTGGGLAEPDTRAGVPYAFDDATVCLTRRGSVTVQRVDVVRPTGGLRVVRFAVRPSRQGRIYNYVSDFHQRLADVGYRTDG